MRNRRYAVGIVAIVSVCLLAVFGCGPKKAPNTPKSGQVQTTQPAPQAAPQPLEPAPEWTQRIHLQEGADHFFVGFGRSNQGETEARDAARAKALGELAQWLNASVDSSIAVEESTDTTQGDVLRIQNKTIVSSKAISVRRPELARQFHRMNGVTSESWVMIRVPGAEIRRIQRLIFAKTAWRFSCEPAELCPPDLTSKLKAFASSRKFKTHGSPLADLPTDSEAIKAMGEEQDAAFVLDVKLVTQNKQKSGDFSFVFARLDWRLFSTDEGTELQVLSIGPEKVGHLTYESAVAKAFAKLMTQLDSEIPAP